MSLRSTPTALVQEMEYSTTQKLAVFIGTWKLTSLKLVHSIWYNVDVGAT